MSAAPAVPCIKEESLPPRGAAGVRSPRTLTWSLWRLGSAKDQGGKNGSETSVTLLCCSGGKIYEWVFSLG